MAKKILGRAEVKKSNFFSILIVIALEFLSGKVTNFTDFLLHSEPFIVYVSENNNNETGYSYSYIYFFEGEVPVAGDKNSREYRGGGGCVAGCLL